MAAAAPRCAALTVCIYALFLPTAASVIVTGSTVLLNVSLVPQAPFLQWGGSGPPTGMAADIFQLILGAMNTRPGANVRYVVANYVPSRDGSFGMPVAPNATTWSGVVGDLLAGSCDVALGAFPITSASEVVLDYITPFLGETLSLLTRKQLEVPNVWGFLQPFAESLWGILFGTTLGFAVMLMIVDRLSPYGYRNSGESYTEKRRLTAREALHNSVQSMMGKDTPAEGGQSWSTRFVFYSMYFFTLVMLANYTASLTAFAAVKRLGVSVTSVADVSAQRLSFCVPGNSSGAVGAQQCGPQHTSDGAVHAQRGKLRCVCRCVAHLFGGRRPRQQPHPGTVHNPAMRLELDGNSPAAGLFLLPHLRLFSATSAALWRQHRRRHVLGCGLPVGNRRHCGCGVNIPQHLQ